MADAKTDLKNYTSDFIKSDTDKAVFLGNPLLDDMMTALINLGAETWANRRRVKIIEMLFEKNGKISRDMVEAYMPTPDEEKKLVGERDEFIRTAFGHFARGAADIVALSSVNPTSKK